tara:strand:+ start:43698 stop:44396 length:699 start_codon:yes stop_codon:yes gene_type:complete
VPRHFSAFRRRVGLASTWLVAATLLSACSLPDFKRESPAPRSVGSAEDASRRQATAPLSIARGETAIGAGMAALLARPDEALAVDEVGYYMDVLLASLRLRLPGEASAPSREQNDLRLLLPGHMTFASGSASLSPGAKALLERVAEVLAEYRKTQVVIEGHSDTQGDPGYNQTLSEQRALSVARFLAGRAVSPARLVAVGYGASRPLAENSTEAGRRSNRRVELLIRPVVGP